MKAIFIPMYERTVGPFRDLLKNAIALVLLEIDEIIIAIYSFKSTDDLYLIL